MAGGETVAINECERAVRPVVHELVALGGHPAFVVQTMIMCPIYDQWESNSKGDPTCHTGALIRETTGNAIHVYACTNKTRYKITSRHRCPVTQKS